MEVSCCDLADVWLWLTLCVSRRNPILQVQWDSRNFPLWSIFCMPPLWWRTTFFKCQRWKGKTLGQTRTRVLALLVTARFLYPPTVPQTERGRCWAFLSLMFSVWGARGSNKATRYNFLELVSYVNWEDLFGFCIANFCIPANAEQYVSAI